MKYEFYSTQEFIKELKALSKKYKSLKDDVKNYKKPSNLPLLKILKNNKLTTNY